MRYLIKYSYDGSKYNGYQKQPRKRTIQRELEKALKEINANKKVLVSSSGRTDKGVHANNQYAHFDLIINIKPDNLKRALNSILPDDIYIKDVKEVSDNFHARFDVKKKEYIYKINIGEYNPIEKDYIYQYCKDLDINEMKKGLIYIEGTHNFKAFTKADDEREDYVRTLSQTNVIRDLKDVSRITLVFIGTGFMRYMVRNMVGTLIEIGEGKRRSEEIIDILASEDRRRAGKTADAQGLFLKNVFY